MNTEKKTTLHKDGSSALLNIALEKEGEKKRKDRTVFAKSYPLGFRLDSNEARIQA